MVVAPTVASAVNSSRSEFSSRAGAVHTAICSMPSSESSPRAPSLSGEPLHAEPVPAAHTAKPLSQHAVMAAPPPPSRPPPAPLPLARMALPLRAGGGLPSGSGHGLPTRQLGEQFWNGIHATTLLVDEQWLAVRQFVLTAC